MLGEIRPSSLLTEALSALASESPLLMALLFCKAETGVPRIAKLYKTKDTFSAVWMMAVQIAS